MKKIKIYFVSVLVSLAFMSCDDWLDLEPNNAQTAKQYWNTTKDVQSVVGASYVKLRESVDYLYIWGEARGTGLDVLTVADSDMKGVLDIKELKATDKNKYVKWSSIYEIIKMTNSVLKYAPEVLKKDPSFTQAEMNGYFSEVYFVRALAYFYLVRTFKEVPLILEPYVDDKQSFNFPKSSEDAILKQITEDLILALKSAKEYYPEVDNNNPANTKGRATVWSINALLADIYLWQGDYDKCIDACDVLLKSNRLGLLSTSKWFTNYYPGNSNESIFEIQYSYSKSQTNKFLEWFYTKQRYAVSLNTISLYEETTPLGDIRGEKGTFIGSYAWKYMGKDFNDSEGSTLMIRNTGTENDQNFILYRLADIYLMKAEALIMKGGETNWDDAVELIAKIRERAGIVENLTKPSTETEMINLLMGERMREFCGEGKAWFDLLRIAKRDNYKYKDYMITQVMASLNPQTAEIVRSKLLNEGSHYLPIHNDEISANKLLEQNSYYKSLGY
ncbi:MAG: RagB/SusD family nutrient uptake outer membrane protein [Dysgonomonas sp.]